MDTRQTLYKPNIRPDKTSKEFIFTTLIARAHELFARDPLKNESFVFTADFSQFEIIFCWEYLKQENNVFQLAGPALERVAWVEIHPSSLSNGWHPPVLKLDYWFLESNFRLFYIKRGQLH